MIYLNKFGTHTSYEAELNGGVVEISLPNVSYCEDVKDVHYTPYNLVRFYVGEITSTKIVKIYTDTTNHLDVTVSGGNKWYTYVLPKDKSLCKIESGYYDDEEGEWYDGIVKKVVVKANIKYNYDENNETYNGIVPWEITEASFKGSNTSNVTSMKYMFYYCSNLTSLDLRNFNTSNVTIMSGMFQNCNGLTSLDLSSFDTRNVTRMSNMFSDCSGLTSLYLSNFNTSNVTDMSGMFQNCNGLTLLDLSGWDTSKVTDMYRMFYGRNKLNTIIMKGCSKETIDKIKAQLTKDGITGANITT